MLNPLPTLCPKNCIQADPNNPFDLPTDSTVNCIVSNHANVDPTVKECTTTKRNQNPRIAGRPGRIEKWKQDGKGFCKGFGGGRGLFVSTESGRRGGFLVVAQGITQGVSELQANQAITMIQRVRILLFLPAFGASLSLKSNVELPSDPCIHRTKQCSVDSPGLASLSEVGCPRYQEGVFDGKVCVGCFRDDYEIDHWDDMSCAEKAYALEDASQRLESLGSEREGAAVSMQDLKSQSSLWMALAEKEQSQQASNDDPIDSNKFPKANPPASSNPSAPKIDSIREPATSFTPNIETKSTNRAAMDSIASDTTRKESSNYPTNSTLPETNEDDKLQQQQAKNRQQAPPPPTPCTRICRYNADCYDGNVCIGCFRDEHDIAQWSGMSPQEKMFSLEDAADRCKDLSQKAFEGGITEAALREQALQWGAWKG